MTYCPPCASSTPKAPVVARKHYCIPPLERVNVAELLALIAQERYFVLHAPRQTGKTSALLALRDLLEAGGAGDYRCVYVNVEAAQAVGEDVERAMRVILGELPSSRATGSWTGSGPTSWRDSATPPSAPRWHTGAGPTPSPWCC